MEIHHADKAYRNRGLVLLAGISVLAGALLWQLNLWLQELTMHLASGDPDTVRGWLRMLLAALGFALAVPAAALGLSLRRLGQSSRIQGRFPPQELRTLRDVRVLRDQPALRWARRVERFGALSLALAGVLASWALWAMWHFH